VDTAWPQPLISLYISMFRLRTLLHTFTNFYLGSELVGEGHRTVHVLGTKPLEGEHHLHQHPHHQQHHLVAQVKKQAAGTAALVLTV
jgi:hypothetical protein